MRLLFIPLTAVVVLCVTASPSYTGDDDSSIVDKEHIIRKRHPHYYRRPITGPLPRPYARPGMLVPPRVPVARPYVGPRIHHPHPRLVGR
ncbi:hypothetical protein M514_23097 [Trichuris suis]|uniref:Uncharacterized protein n=1 Tax=Trichuris suis TaxID=68888 RepID=A0A085N5M8_9BILA|nr:hypothetical protein M514_23097 [Trichuris suis]